MVSVKERKKEGRRNFSCVYRMLYVIYSSWSCPLPASSLFWSIQYSIFQELLCAKERTAIKFLSLLIPFSFLLLSKRSGFLFFLSSYSIHLLERVAKSVMLDQSDGSCSSSILPSRHGTLSWLTPPPLHLSQPSSLFGTSDRSLVRSTRSPPLLRQAIENRPERLPCCYLPRALPLQQPLHTLSILNILRIGQFSDRSSFSL